MCAVWVSVAVEVVKPWVWHRTVLPGHGTGGSAALADVRAVAVVTAAAGARG